MLVRSILTNTLGSLPRNEDTDWSVHSSSFVRVLARIAHSFSAADTHIAESFDEFLPRVLDSAVLCLRPRSGEFVKIFNHLRLLARKCCERCGFGILTIWVSMGINSASGQTTSAGIWVREEKADVSIECVAIGTGAGKLSLSVRAPNGKLITRRSYLASEKLFFDIKVPSSVGVSAGSYEAVSSSSVLVPYCQVVGAPRGKNADFASHFRFSPPTPQTGTQYLQVSSGIPGESGVLRRRAALFNASSVPVGVKISLYDSSGQAKSESSVTAISLQPSEVRLVSLEIDSAEQPALLIAVPDRMDAAFSLLGLFSREMGSGSGDFSTRVPRLAACESSPIFLPVMSGSRREVFVSNTSNSPSDFELALYDGGGSSLGVVDRSVAGLGTVSIPLHGFDQAAFVKTTCKAAGTSIDSGGLLSFASISTPSISENAATLSQKFETFPADPIAANSQSFGIINVLPGVSTSAIFLPYLNTSSQCNVITFDRSGTSTSSVDYDLIGGCMTESPIETEIGNRLIELNCSPSLEAVLGGLFERRSVEGEPVFAFTPFSRITRLTSPAQKISAEVVDQLGEARKIAIEGQLLFKDGKFEDSIAKFTQAAKLAPRYHCVLGWLIEAYERNGNRSAALATVKQLLAFDGVNRFGRSKEAQYLLESGNYREAYGILNELLIDAPMNPELNTSLGITLIRLGRRDEAHQRLLQALAIAPRSPLTLWGLLELYDKEGNEKEIKNVEDDILGIPLSESRPQRDTVILRGARAFVFARRSLNKLSVNELKEADKLAPGDHRVVWNLAEQLGTLKLWDSALPYARQATRLYPDNQAYIATLAWILLEKGEVQQAKKILTDAIRDGLESARIRVNLGMVFARSNELIEARRQFDAATKLDPADWLGFNNIGWISELQGQYGDAYEYYMKAATLDPDNELIGNNLSNLKLKLSKSGSEGTSDKE